MRYLEGRAELLPRLEHERRLGMRERVQLQRLELRLGVDERARLDDATPRHPPAVRAQLCPQLVVQPHGTAGGLAPKPPRLLTKKPRPAPWTESVERECAAARPKKKARRK